jgi:hypothetical protein
LLILGSNHANVQPLSLASFQCLVHQRVVFSDLLFSSASSTHWHSWQLNPSHELSFVPGKSISGISSEPISLASLTDCDLATKAAPDEIRKLIVANLADEGVLIEMAVVCVPHPGTSWVLALVALDNLVSHCCNLPLTLCYRSRSCTSVDQLLGPLKQAMLVPNRT